MAERRARIEITGIAPLIMHNGELANPLNPIVQQMKAITDKRTKKTMADLENLQKLEFLGGLYISPDGDIAFPEAVLCAIIRDGARETRKGKLAEATVYVVDDWSPVLYDGPRDPEVMYAQKMYDVRSVKVQRNRVMRCRPVFQNWKVAFTIAYNDQYIELKDIETWLNHTGNLKGMGDNKPRYGRFHVSKVQAA